MPQASDPDAPAGRVRLQKFLSDAGVASRRKAEELILAGRVLVNQQIVDTLPAFVDPRADRVIVDGTPVRLRPPLYFLVHKPKGVVCTNRDPAGRPRAIDLLPPLAQRLFPVGRLDEESSGLLLMTNDGELAQQIAHPRYGVPKTYRVEVKGRVPPDLQAQLMRGVYLAEGKARAAGVEVVHRSNDRSVLKITLREGRNRQIRRMLARLGHPVLALKRVAIGPLSLKNLPVGAARELTPVELKALRGALADQRPPRRRPAGQSRRTPPEQPPAAGPKAPGRARPDSPRPGGPPTRRIVT